MTMTTNVQVRPTPAVEPPVGDAEPAYMRQLRRYSIPMLRIALGIVFVWFGALKVLDLTPVGDLVAGAVPWFDKTWFVPALGGFEVVVGLLLMSGRWVRLTCAAMIAHLCGTFMVYLMEPGVAFEHGNPLLMTMAGEFVAKNIVLITAGLAVMAWSAHRARGAR
ncbi:MAG: DoxX family membrane protein [Streptosporangiales bacterium]|nr:DoxX family membrane protein [Streptosporangiales bacterium]MBO0889966.1 DoxX family membrane protein [Acidothermales bacterium]